MVFSTNDEQRIEVCTLNRISGTFCRITRQNRVGVQFYEHDVYPNPLGCYHDFNEFVANSNAGKIFGEEHSSTTAQATFGKRTDPATVVDVAAVENTTVADTLDLYEKRCRRPPPLPR